MVYFNISFYTNEVKQTIIKEAISGSKLFFNFFFFRNYILGSTGLKVFVLSPSPCPHQDS